MSAYSERFLDRVAAIPFAGCWLWLDALDRNGYARCVALGECQAHRVAWRLFVGPIPDGMDVLYRCDVRCCVNPAHLWLGTHQANISDRNEKGRSARLRGEQNGNHRLTEEQVRDILTSKDSQRAAARKHGVSRGLIHHIRKRKTWAHVGVF